MSIKKGTEFQFNWSTTALADVNPATVKGHNWTRNDNIQSTEVSSEREDNTVTTRLNGGTDVSLGGKRSDELQFQIAYDPTDTMYQAIKAAYDADTPIALADADGDITQDGTTCDVGMFYIKTFRSPRGESGAAQATFTAKPSAIFGLGVVTAGA